MRKSLLTASSNLVLFKKGLVFQILLFGMLLGLSGTQITFAQCIGPYQAFESVPQDISTLTGAGWSFSTNLGVYDDGNGGTFRTGARGLFNYDTVNGEYVITPTIATPQTFSFYLFGDDYDLLVGDGLGTWYSLLDSTNRTNYNVTSFVLPALTNFSEWQLISVTFGTSNSLNSNVKFKIVDNGPFGSLLIDDIAWTSRTASENTIVVPELGNSSCSPITVPAAGTGFLTLYDQGGSSDEYNRLQTQTITFAPAIASEKVQITFQSPFAINGASGGTASTISVYNGPTTASTVLLNAYTSTSTLPGVTVYASTDSSGNITVRFVSGTGAPLSGYKIKVECVGCPAPTALAFAAAGGVSHNSAFLTWSGTAANYEVYYSTTNTAPTGATSPNGGTVATTSATVTGLSASTLYYFWVRSNCGSGSVSSWLGPISTTTLCTPQTVTYLETFNGLVGGVLPTCTSATASSWQSNSVNGNLFCNGVGQSFFTQGVTLTAGQLYRLTYDYASNLNGTADMQVFFGSPVNNVAPTVSNVNSLLATHNTFSSVTTNVLNFVAPTSGTFYIRFLLSALSNTGSGALNLDNVRLEIENCLPPTFPGSPVSGVNDFGATIAWNVPSTGAPSNGYYYYLSTSSTPPGYYDTETGAVSSTGVTLSSLSSNTTYYVWVRSNCGGQISTWSSSYASFTTTNVSIPTVIKVNDTTGPYTVACGSTTNITFTDSGGTAGNYSNNEKVYFPLPSTAVNVPYSYTFKTDGTPGAKLMVIFNTFNVELGWDGLMIYSGLDNTGTLMSSGRVANHPKSCPTGAWTGTTSPGTILSTAADGSLTFEFTSDDSVTPFGWTATIKCVSSPPTITSFTPTDNNCGSSSVSVVITGTGFTSVTGVNFNGVSASYVVNSPTQITATVPATATTGKIKVITSTFSATSSTDFTVNNPPPVTTGAVVCTGGSGSLSSSTVCDAWTPVTNITNSLTTGSPTAFRQVTGTTCNLSGTSAYYNATQITVSVSGSYTFETSDGGIDFFAYITSGSFTPGSCASGTVIAADDDSGSGVQPKFTVNLTAGVVYTLYTTTFFSGTTGSYTWNFITPVGGSVMTFQAASITWYTVASGGTPIGSGNPYNPVGVAGSGLPNTLTPGTYNFYGACSSNPGCRTLTTFVIGNAVGGTVSSSQNICGGSFADLVLSGSAGTVTKWQYADDAAFTVNLTDVPSSASTTLTSAQIGSFVGTRYYRVVVTVGSCTTAYSTTATLTYNRVIWAGGVWSNGTGPTIGLSAEFQEDFVSSTNASPSGNLSACSVIITNGADVLFDVGTLTVQNEVNVSSGFLTIQDNASLYQSGAVTNAPGVYSGGNSGNITSQRVAEPMYKFDYTYWSSPVNPQNLLAVSPASPTNWFLTYNAASNAWAYVTSPGTTTMTVGKGYLIRAPLNYPVSPALPLDYTASFIGVPNNGTFTTPIVGGASQMNLIGNPYPSALNAPDFINGNPNVSGTLYFWTHNTPINPVTFQYTASDYAIFNLVGGTLAAPTTGAGTSDLTPPLGNIASGQGFFVKGLSNGTATFSNSMRRAGNNTQFYRLNTRENNDNDNDDALEKHRYWIDIANSQGAFKQILIGYVETATSGLDRLFDGDMVDVGNAVTLYTTVEDTKLSIQGKPLPFDVNETIPLGYKSTIDGTFTISLSHYDGLFTSQHVYVEDKVLNIIHDLRVSSYTFATLAGTFDNRFELRYTDTALGTTNPVFNDNSVIVYKNNQGLYIDSGAVNMATVSIFDIRGRLLATQKQVDRTTTVFTTLPTTNQVLLVRIESENGAIVTKKVVY
ncbi:T9SS sorting signal type C domain-containing protein [Flavobacterium sp. AS60]|uniref:T9SS sorting signal type C domain-containing protein n=1 Tax=Flavobacterium anseongense TaxID=2910677 RepID=UPI001F2A0C5B|nr:T9SS sorting signal type C domain-containing protein [Flavobacterium sp. AS60]MCF6130238.1 T9SS sorting signal type C domain-containing protein [Flavobacterium sp. AS60]